MKTGAHRSVIAVDEASWLEAQKFERAVWEKLNRENSRIEIAKKFLRALKNDPMYFLKLLRYRDFYAGDDWNFWWKEAFEGYQVLPKRAEKALEIGCGPYTNIRLISKILDISEIHCLDPLMYIYLGFKHNWLSEAARKKKIFTYAGKGEKLPFDDGNFDLVIINNVLDHVEDASVCLEEAHRVLKPGGYLVFGQDLSNEGDIERQRREDRGFVGHPIKLHQEALDAILAGKYEIKFKKTMSREESRNPKHHYGTYLFIGAKISAR